MTEERRKDQKRKIQESSNPEDSQSPDLTVEGLSEATNRDKPPPNVILNLLIVYLTHK